jgi:hypothetical protein
MRQAGKLPQPARSLTRKTLAAETLTLAPFAIAQIDEAA